MSEMLGGKRLEEAAKGTVPVGPGALSVEQLEGILNSLPVDITFVDADDTVRYYSETKDRIFVRSRSVIGRKVQQCHPQKSVHVVERILQEFRSGERDVAEFWIPLEDKLVHIRYFPVRAPDGRYLGTMEVTQDIAPLKKIEGEKRLLDEPGEEE
ncbi:MAG: PAS domain-containing protein [Candidatus Bipolaricaulota bacterium]